MQRMLALKALRPHLYGTRRLEAGDEYEAPTEEAIAHVAMRKADFAKSKPPTFAEKKSEAAPPAPQSRQIEPATEAVEEPTIDDLRLQATQLGIDVDGRWGMARLRYEIDQAKRR
jgi:hypothetical protein